MTSNVGARNITEQKTIGFNNTENKEKNYEQIKGDVMNELKKAFRPEFLNRIDEIIVFKPLDEMEIEKIVEIMIKSSTGRLAEREISIEVTENMKKHIAEKGFDPAYGARPLRRAIQSLIEDTLAEEILDGKVKNGDNVVMDFVDEKVVVKTK